MPAASLPARKCVRAVACGATWYLSRNFLAARRRTILHAHKRRAPSASDLAPALADFSPTPRRRIWFVPSMAPKVKLLGSGVVTLQRALELPEQRALLDDSLRSMPLLKAGGVHLGARPPPGAAMSFESDREPPTAKRPACLRIATELLSSLSEHHRVGAIFAADSREQSAPLHLMPLLQRPEPLAFKNVWARLYTEDNALGWHRDPYHGLKGWVCIINLGASTVFAWRHGGHGAMVHRTTLASGDALIFNGEVLEHAIEEVHDEGTCPSFWRELIGGGQKVVRIGLQMRP